MICSSIKPFYAICRSFPEIFLFIDLHFNIDDSSVHIKFQHYKNELKNAFVSALNRLISDSESYLETLQNNITYRSCKLRCQSKYYVGRNDGSQ